MSNKDCYIVTLKEFITDGTMIVNVWAGCAEEVEEKAKALFAEYLDPEDMDILDVKRVQVNESEIEKD
jgi:hypothetical protein